MELVPFAAFVVFTGYFAGIFSVVVFFGTFFDWGFGVTGFLGFVTLLVILLTMLVVCVSSMNKICGGGGEIDLLVSLSLSVQSSFYSEHVFLLSFSCPF